MQSELILDDRMKREIHSLDLLIKNRDQLEKRNFEPVWAMLFVGPPGCGKTTLANELARHFDLDVVEKATANIVQSSMGSSARNLVGAFQEAKNKCLIFNEFDAISMTRTNREEAANHEQNRIVSTMLQMMDSVKNRPELLIGTTNRLDDIDPAILRRFSKVVQFGEPSKEAFESLAKKMCEKHLFSLSQIPRHLYLGEASMAMAKKNIEQFMIMSIIEGENPLARQRFPMGGYHD